MRSCAHRALLVLFIFAALGPAGERLLPDGGEAPAPGQSKLQTTRVMRSFGALPLGFERNVGQVSGLPGRGLKQPPERIKFLSRGRNYTLFLTDAGPVLNLSPIHGSGRQAEVRMKLLDGNPEARIEGLDPLASVSNYFIGSNSRKWLTNISQFSRVRYRQAYPGIDLVFYGREGLLEYDFVVSPGADPNRIRLVIEGAEQLRVDDRGDLVCRTAAVEIRHRKPLVYQEINGARQEVAGRYAVRGRRVSFEVASYDARRPLVIDPILEFSTYLGGTNTDAGLAIAVDSAGSAYVTGNTSSTNFPTANAFQRTKGADVDVFVAKLNPSGTALIYSTYLGGGSSDNGRGIAADSAGNAYITGLTNSTDFPTTPGVLRPTGGNDAFVTKLNPTGTALVYSTYLGGTSSEFAEAIAVDAAGSAYIVGETASTNFPVSAGAPQARFGGGSSDAFAAKLNAGGTALVYATYLGGSITGSFGFPDEYALSVAVDAQGNAYIAGWTPTSNFPVTTGALQSRFGGGNSDAYVAKLNAAGTALVYSTYLGGTSSDRIEAIAIDAAGNAYVTGETSSSNFPLTAGVLRSTLAGTSDGFVAKLNTSGAALVYSTFLGGRARDRGLGIAVDSAGSAFISGATDSSDFHLTDDAFQRQNRGPDTGFLTGDAFLSRINATGTAVLYSTYIGGTGSDTGHDLALDRNGNVYMTGSTSSTNFPTSIPIQAARAGDNEAFIAKVDFSCGPCVSPRGVVNAASFLGGPIAAGEIISLFGAGIGPTTGVGAQLAANGRVATSVGETTVLFDGVPGPLFFARNDQINVQVPYSVIGRPVTQLQVRYRDRPSNTVSVPIADTAPGIFAVSGGRGAGAILNEDSSVNGRSNPAPPGSVVVIYATGEGQTDPSGIEGKLSEPPYPRPVFPASVTIGGASTEVLFAGAAPGFAGLFQMNARVPSGVALGTAVPVSLTVGSTSSQPGVTLTVGHKFRLSNLRAGPGTNSSSGARLPLTMDFDDPSGTATSGGLRYSLAIGTEFFSFGGVTPQGVTPGQTQGTMNFTLTFPGFSFRIGQTNAPVSISLTNSTGIESNSVGGTFVTQ